MGPRTEMKEPICLIESDAEGRLSVHPVALGVLSEIDQEVVVIAVVGLYRTGKSYLMNKLAGANKGFALGSTIQSKTKGIWMWCVPHPKKPNCTLVLLDTEGLGDVEKGDERNDIWIFSMAVLLSSALVYNSMGTIDNNALEKLHYVTQLTEHIKVRSDATQEDNEAEYMAFFPSFVWAVRDFTLELEIDGKEITANEYLENALKMKPGLSDTYNQPRYCIRNYFNPRSCFVFERPASGSKMRRMEEMTDNDLDPSFVQQAKDFCDHMYNTARVKVLQHGIKITGRVLGNMAKTYIEAIRSGKVPCLDNAVQALAEIENGKAVDQARASYKDEMQSRIAFPTETLDELSDIHAACLHDALAVFMKHSFKDENHLYQKKLMDYLEEDYCQICERNKLESQKKCEDIIKRVFGPMEERLSSGYYTVAGGYKIYRTDQKQMIDEYRSTEGKGVKAEDVLKKFLDDKENTGQAIMKADESLTEAEQKAHEEQVRREAMEQEQRALAECLQAQQKKIEDQQKSHDENIRQLNEKMEKDQKAAAEEFKRVMEAKNKEIAEFQKQGFSEKALQLEKEIAVLRAQMANRPQPSGGCIII